MWCGYNVHPEACSCEKSAYYDSEKTRVQDLRAENKARINNLFPLPPDIGDFTFNNFTVREGTEACFSTAQDFCDNFVDEYLPSGNGLYFYSNAYGCGKTHLMNAVINNLKNYFSCIVVKYDQLLNLYFSTFDKNSSLKECEILYCLNHSDVLFIDDIGVGKWSKSKEELLFKIFDSRKYPTLVTANSEALGNLKDENAESSRILSRITGKCISVENTATDYRNFKLQSKLALTEQEQ